MLETNDLTVAEQRLVNELKEACSPLLYDFIFDNYDVSETDDAFMKVYYELESKIFVPTYTDWAIDEGKE